jgi:hypothetical protein
MIGRCWTFIAIASMTKPEMDFAHEDLAMARRALWLLEGHAPGAEQPPLDLDVNRFEAFAGAGGFLVPLAHFGQARRDDALLAKGWTGEAARSTKSEGESGQILAMRRDRARAEACRHEKRANDDLREARRLIGNAKRLWSLSSELRVDEAKVGALALGDKLVAFFGPTGEHEAILAELSNLERGFDRAITALAPSASPRNQRRPVPEYAWSANCRANRGSQRASCAPLRPWRCSACDRICHGLVKKARTTRSKTRHRNASPTCGSEYTTAMPRSGGQ